MDLCRYCSIEFCMGTVVWSTAFSVLCRYCVVLLSLPPCPFPRVLCRCYRWNTAFSVLWRCYRRSLPLSLLCDWLAGRQAELLLFFTLSKYMWCTSIYLFIFCEAVCTFSLVFFIMQFLSLMICSWFQNLFVYVLFCDAVQNMRLRSIAWWMKKDMNGSNHHLMCVNVMVFAWKDGRES